MAFSYLSNERLEDARSKFLDALNNAGFASFPCETVQAASSLGRVTSKPVYAAISAPHYPACAMDGIAVSARDTFGATETTPVTLAPSAFRRVDTGDPLPDGCDAVIMAEEVSFAQDGSAEIRSAAAPWQHVRQIGEDICAGEMIMPSFTRITPAAAGAMLAAGTLSASVVRRPRVGIIPTGDEIVPPTGTPRPGDVIEFNSTIFSAQLTEWGAEPVVYPIVRDDRAAIRAALEKAVSECDVVLLGAGSSAGRDDYSAEIIAEIGTVLVHGLAIRPGKPAILGLSGAKAVIGVPGYPVSGIIVLEEIVRPLIEMWFGCAGDVRGTAEAVLSRSVVSGLKYREFVRVRLGRVGGSIIASPLSRGAGVVSSFMKADGIMEVPLDREGIEAGSRVSVSLLRPMRDIERTLVITGSHDPMLDETADMMRRAGRSFFTASTHVGSMGGIMAVRRGEAHAAGVHLLDESDGSYNISYIKKYIPDGGVRLVECVGRAQGIMTAPGNPLGISSVADLAKNGVRFVNRQKGSGTRILFDYLLKKCGASSSDVYGYEREELTHMSVAVQIASGTADAGMGIYSAAKLYGLDFIHICDETYDLLIPDSAWELPSVKLLLDVLRSDEFRRRAESLGGYTVSEPGRVKFHAER